MGTKNQTVLGLIMKYFLDSLKPNFARRKLVGEDYYGTKYYETQPRKNSIHNKPNRHFEPVNRDKFDQEIPAEWEAWLRQRRREPPTAEEVKQNYQTMLLKKKNAAELEASYAEKYGSLTVSNSEGITTEQTSQKQSHSSTGGYPVYEEYKDFGQKYKPKI